LDNAHADIKNILHQLLAAARVALLLLFVGASAQDSHAEHIQTLGLDGNSNNLTVSLLAEAFFEQTLNNSLELALDTALQYEGGLLVLNTSVIATGVGGVNTGNLGAREQ
jgi:hypothetical protein